MRAGKGSDGAMQPRATVGPSVPDPCGRAAVRHGRVLDLRRDRDRAAKVAREVIED